jgi:DNA-binding Xre family transcriptional regulator
MLSLRPDNPSMSDFTETLEWWIARRDLNPTRLATLAGLDKTMVRQIIVQDRTPRLDTVQKLCEALDVTVDQFLARDDDPRRRDLWRLLGRLSGPELSMLQAAARGIADRRNREDD